MSLGRRRSGFGWRDGQTGDGGSAAECPKAAHYGIPLNRSAVTGIRFRLCVVNQSYESIRS